MLQKYKPNMTAPLLVTCVYIFLILSRITVGGTVTGGDEYIRNAVLQIFIFLLPAVIYYKLCGEGYSSRLRLKMPGAQQLLVSFFAVLTLICGTVLMNILLYDSVKGNASFLLGTPGISYTSNAAESLYALVAYAALPAICEEFLFRALIPAGYEEYGIGSAFLMSSLFFAMCSFGFGGLVTGFFAGALLFASVYATRSIVSGMVIHFAFNLYRLFGADFMDEVYGTTGSTELFLLLAAASFLFFGAMFFGEAARLYRRYCAQNRSSDYLPKKSDKKGGASSRPAIVECLIAPPAVITYVIFILGAIFL